MPVLDPSPIDVYSGPFGPAQATRLLWRAGFGPAPGQAAYIASLGLERAVATLTRPVGQAVLNGAAPLNATGGPLDPVNVPGDAQCWWLDRMVRGSQPLVERMTLVWHSWLTSSTAAAPPALMLAQNELMRGHALGNFHRLLEDVTRDPAMLLWLNGNSNERLNPNENYAREMLELFTLGAGRGYTQDDVHQNALALTGWTNDWTPDGHPVNFRFEPALHDHSVKTMFGRQGRFDWKDSCRLAVSQPAHPTFMVEKLWGYFVPTPPPAGCLHALEQLYVQSRFEVRPLLEAILRHPDFYGARRMVVPPAVYCAGLLRATGQSLSTDGWAWITEQMGQMLFAPPNVAGWDYTDWLDTSRWAGRVHAVALALQPQALNPKSAYPATETPQDALAAALQFWGGPALSASAQASLLAFGDAALSGATLKWQQVPYRVQRQNALRALIALSPDWQTC